MLAEKNTQRIRVTYSKLISYASRLQIINAILFYIHNFWGTVFIIPQSILKEVDMICKEYLWSSSEEKKKLPLVAWENICYPKKLRGLNVKGIINWNIASVGKLLWQLIKYKEALWVKWVNGVYMKAEANI